MADIIDFSLERAKRKSGMRDTSVLKDMIEQGYDPCDPKQIQEYQDWTTFQNIIYDDVDIGHNWTDEALNRLFDDIKNFDPTQNVTYTVDVDDDKINELVIDTDSNLDFSHLLPKK